MEEATGPLCAGCAYRARYGDGRIRRDCGARLARVKPDTLSSWVSRGYIKDVRYEGSGKRKIPWYNVKEIIEAEFELHKGERARMARVLGVLDSDEAVA